MEMKRPNTIVLVLVAASAAYLTAFSLTVQGQTGTAPEAPTGFDNKTNGFTTQAQFDADRAMFEERDDIAKGLGPVYNAQSCGECHQSPVTGAGSQISELRAGHLDSSGNFVDAPGGSLINDRAIDASIQEHVPRRREHPHVPDVHQRARQRLRRGDQLEHARRDCQRAARAEQRRHQRAVHPGAGARSAGQHSSWPVRLEGSELEPAVVLGRRVPERNRHHQSAAAHREHVDGQLRRGVRHGVRHNTVHRRLGRDLRRGSGPGHRGVRPLHAGDEGAAARRGAGRHRRRAGRRRTCSTRSAATSAT